MTAATSGAGYQGQAGIADGNTLYNLVRFLIQQMLGKVRTVSIVQVTAVYQTGVAAVGQVDARPLVNLVDGVMKGYPHSDVHGLPFFRLQGGSNAVICDPAVGDIGVALIGDRDNSIVRAQAQQGQPVAQNQANPGSRRRFSFSDGMYLGGFLNGIPKQYLYFTATGLQLTDMSGNQITTGSGGISLQPCSGGKVTIDGIAFETHKHTGVQTGSGETGGPTS